MNIIPMNDLILVKPIQPVNRSSVFVNNELPTAGRVVAVGPGKVLENGQRSEISKEIKPGSLITFSNGSLQPHAVLTETGREVIFFIKAENVIGVEAY